MKHLKTDGLKLRAIDGASVNIPAIALKFLGYIKSVISINKYKKNYGVVAVLLCLLRTFAQSHNTLYIHLLWGIGYKKIS